MFWCLFFLAKTDYDIQTCAAADRVLIWYQRIKDNYSFKTYFSLIIVKNIKGFNLTTIKTLVHHQLKN